MSPEYEAACEVRDALFVTNGELVEIHKVLFQTLQTLDAVMVMLRITAECQVRTLAVDNQGASDWTTRVLEMLATFYRLQTSDQRDNNA